MTSKLERLPLEDFFIDKTELGTRTKELLVKRRNAYKEERITMFRYSLTMLDLIHTQDTLKLAKKNTLFTDESYFEYWAYAESLSL